MCHVIVLNCIPYQPIPYGIWDMGCDTSINCVRGCGVSSRDEESLPRAQMIFKQMTGDREPNGAMAHGLGRDKWDNSDWTGCDSRGDVLGTWVSMDGTDGVTLTGSYTSVIVSSVFHVESIALYARHCHICSKTRRSRIPRVMFACSG